LAKSKGALAVLMAVGQKQEDFIKRRDQLKDHLQKPALAFTYKNRPGAFFISINLSSEILGTTAKVLYSENDKRIKMKAGKKI
jgi:hypothetical protein